MLIDTTTNAPGAEEGTAPPLTIGDYRILRTLGRGGMAVVYHAEHARTGERVALKTVGGADAGLRSSIRREIHALRRVDHPGVVRIVAEGVEGDLPWYAMEVVEGRTLVEYLADLGEIDETSIPAAMTPTRIRGSEEPTRASAQRFRRAANGALLEILTVLRGVCDALAFVHGMGLVHRDLKPENIMVRDDGSPVLVDFGLSMQLRGARGRDVLELGERFMGTPGYMAPEQIDGELMDARVDLYALGCILYECVTGTVPFLGTTEQVLDQQIGAAPERPSARVGDVPPELDDLILALLQKRPRNRIGYADDVAAALVRLGAGDSPRARRAEPHLYRPRLAGRADALAIVDKKLRLLSLGRGGRVLVAGESGVGKTRFAIEVGLSANRRGLDIITGQCISVSAADAELKATSLHPLRHLLSTISDHCRERGFAETERIFGERGPALAVHEPSIGRLPGQELYARLAELPAAASRARLDTCLAEVLAAFAAPQPLVLVLEDLQWADEATMSFLQSLDEAYFSASRVLLLGTYRADETSPELRALAAATDVTRIDLGRLDQHAVQRMVSDMISMPAPPAPFIKFLIDRAEGHPFFVAEYVRIAVQERMIFRNDAGEWQFQSQAANDRSPYDILPLPGELRELVIRRVASLGATALEAARMAAVLGREIDAGVLAAAVGLDDTTHLEAVEELRARQIIEIERGRLRFAHDKLREIIHAEIGEDERRRLHAAAGAAIEARYAGAPEIAGFYPDLVHHFTTARDHDKAFAYLMKAGQAALDAAASGQALVFFRRAVALDDARVSRGAAALDQLERARLEARLGLAAFNVGLLPEAERVTQAALHRLRGEPATSRRSAPGAFAALVVQLVPHALHLLGPKPRAVVDPLERQRLTEAAQTAQKLTEIHFLQQEWVRGLGTALQAVTLAGRLGVSIELIQGYVMLGFGLSTVPLPRLRALYAARAQEAADELANPRGLAWVAWLAGASALFAGRWSEARASLGVALGHASLIQDPRQIELCLGMLATIERYTGRPEDALMLCDDLSVVAKKNGSDQCQIWALGGQGECALALGHVERALALFEQRRIFAEDYRNDPTEWIAHGVLGEAYLAQGDHPRARRVAEDTLRHIEKLRVVSFRFYRGCVTAGETLFALRERATSPRERAELARSAGRICKKMAQYANLYAIGRPQALRLRGLLEASSGRHARARDAFSESAAEARRLAMPLEEAIAHYELGRLQARDAVARASHFTAARAIFAGLGQRLWLDRLDGLNGGPLPGSTAEKSGFTAGK